LLLYNLATGDSFRRSSTPYFTGKTLEHCVCGHDRRQHGSNLECRNCDCL